MFQEDDLLTLIMGNEVFQIDSEKRIYCARGQQFDIFFFDEGNGWSHILATQPASVDGQPTPETNSLIFGLMALHEQYSEEDKE